VLANVKFGPPSENSSHPWCPKLVTGLIKMEMRYDSMGYSRGCSDKIALRAKVKTDEQKWVRRGSRIW